MMRRPLTTRLTPLDYCCASNLGDISPRFILTEVAPPNAFNYTNLSANQRDGNPAMLTVEQLLAAPEEDYMNEAQLEFFRNLLKTQADEVRQSLASAREQLASFQNEPDELDKASIEEERRMALRFLDRQTKLLPKIEQSIMRIDDGDYGYCTVTGEAIGIKRLLIRPTATLCAEEKQRQEMKERNYRDN